MIAAEDRACPDIIPDESRPGAARPGSPDGERPPEGCAGL